MAVAQGRSLRSTPAVVAGVALLTAALRLPFLARQEYPDEGGLLLVARHWSDAGPWLYGALFVDRPPVLIGFFRVADLLGGVLALRLLGLLLAFAIVLLAGLVGDRVGGRRSAVAASIAAAALLTNPMLGSHEINAEIVGLPWVLGAALVGLRARERPGDARWWWAAAGALAAVAPLVKQNLVDGLVFLLVLAIAGWWTGHRGRRAVSGRLLPVVAGASLPLALTVVWAAAGPGLAPLWHDVVTFRASASEVLASASSPANDDRARLLPLIALLSGLGPLLVVAAWRLRRTPVRDPVLLAAAALLLVELAGVVGGGSYWAHYLLALVPGVTLVVAIAAQAPARRLLGGAVAVAVASTLIAGGVTLVRQPEQTLGREARLAAWLDAAHRRGDTGLIVHGQPQVLEMSGLRPAYPYLWSLPTRVLDPRLARMTAAFGAPAGPDWVVELGPLDTWSLDPTGSAQRGLDRGYRQVATVCGFPVLLRDDVRRDLPPTPDC